MTLVPTIHSANKSDMGECIEFSLPIISSLAQFSAFLVIGFAAAPDCRFLPACMHQHPINFKHETNYISLPFVSLIALCIFINHVWMLELCVLCVSVCEQCMCV